MQFKSWLSSFIPIAIGILIGAGLTSNKYVYWLLGSWFVVSFLYSLFAEKILKIKKSADKGVAAKEAVEDIVVGAIDYTEYGNKIGANMFDRFYANYTLLFNLGLIIALCILLWKQLWLYSLVTYFILHLNICLNQILRLVKTKEIFTEGEKLDIPLQKVE
jgi:hypothetical protein